MGRPDGTGRERVAHRLYRQLLEDAGTDPPGDVLEGDGVVPVGSALLEGARHVVLDNIAHGQGAGRPWYGTDDALDVWWPVALDAWRAALRARVGRELHNSADAPKRDEAERRRSASPESARRTGR
jgi:hypothetical protein